MTNDQPDMVYQPPLDDTYRVAWYGVHSNQLHFEKYVLNDVDDGASGSCIKEWVDKAVRNLGNMPTSTKEMLEEMRNFYEEGLDLEILHYAECML